MQEMIAEFNIITLEQYNKLTKDGRKSLSTNNTVVKFSDNTFYHIGRNGSLFKMINQPSLEKEEQYKLARKYKDQVKKIEEESKEEEI
jgi:arginyl-tRNA--protein-N-Asp/Glu arginylyltransferase